MSTEEVGPLGDRDPAPGDALRQMEKADLIATASGEWPPGLEDRFVGAGFIRLEVEAIRGTGWMRFDPDYACRVHEIHNDQMSYLQELHFLLGIGAYRPEYAAPELSLMVADGLGYLNGQNEEDSKARRYVEERDSVYGRLLLDDIDDALSKGLKRMDPHAQNQSPLRVLAHWVRIERETQDADEAQAARLFLESEGLSTVAAAFMKHGHHGVSLDRRVIVSDTTPEIKALCRGMVEMARGEDVVRIAKVYEKCFYGENFPQNLAVVGMGLELAKTYAHGHKAGVFLEAPGGVADLLNRSIDKLGPIQPSMFKIFRWMDRQCTELALIYQENGKASSLPVEFLEAFKRVRELHTYTDKIIDMIAAPQAGFPGGWPDKA